MKSYVQDYIVRISCANDTAAVSNDDIWAGDYIVDVA